MVELDCPWCEETLVIPFDEQKSAETCPECLTTWSYVTTEAPEVALAA